MNYAKHAAYHGGLPAQFLPFGIELYQRTMLKELCSREKTSNQLTNVKYL